MGYYFSYGYNLTLSKMKQTITNQTDPRFTWNGFLLKDLTKMNIDKKWSLPLIQVNKAILNDQTLNTILGIYRLFRCIFDGQKIRIIFNFKKELL